jgi:hypothetical protein
MEPETNRSSALSPEQMAVVNASTNSAVSEAVKAVFASLAPMLKEMTLTPDKLREALKPYQDPAKIARELRETMQSKENEAENRRLERARRDACLHQDGNGKSAICLIHNYPDHQPRGICPICQDLIHPKEWRIAASVEEAIKQSPPGTPERGSVDSHRGKAYIVPAHRDYRTVMAIESHS